MCESFWEDTTGLVGVIARTTTAYDRFSERLSRIFPSKSGAVVRREWVGKGMKVVTLQRPEDTDQQEQEVKAQIPTNGIFDALAYGWFFETEHENGPKTNLIMRKSVSLLTGFPTLGKSAFSRLNGAWSAVVYDREHHRAFFARDVTGVETLYVAREQDSILFASDLRFLKILGVTAALDEQAIAEFLHYLYVPAPRTILRGIEAVLPGHVLVVDDAGCRQERFVASRFTKGSKLDTDEQVRDALSEALPQFEYLLNQSVRSCLPRHGRLGLLLSGGKDSSALAVALKQVAPERVLCITVGSSDPRFDESQDAQALCEFLGLSHLTYTPKAHELLSGLQDLVACQDQPCGDPASLPLFLALRQLPKDVSMIWDGTGNDYYFGIVRDSGYYSYLRRVSIQQVMPDWLWRLFVLAMRFGPRRYRSQAKEWHKEIEESFVSWEGWTAKELSALFGYPISFRETQLWKVMHNYPLEDWITLQTEVICGIWEPHTAFRKVVHAVRSSGKTVRFPFIDTRLASFINDLPQELKFQNYTNKVLLRAYLAKYLPDRFLQKPKGSFVFDQNLLLAEMDEDWLNSHINKAFQVITSAWSRKPIEELVRRRKLRPEQDVDKMYALCILLAWVAAGHAS